MNRHLVTGFIISGVLAGCASYQPSAQQRGLVFPLPSCNATALEKATQLQGKGNQALPGFNPDWVCVTPPEGLGNNALAPESPQQELVRLEAQAFSGEEQRLRETLESPFTRLNGTRPALGIALSGGGSKASAFAIGVLAGLADQKLLDSADYISSVSGGGYAAYFYYSHRIFPVVRNANHDRSAPDSEALFRDCIMLPDAKQADPAVRKKIKEYGACLPGDLLYSNTVEDGSPAKDNTYQAFLRCQQDVFKPGTCSVLRTSEDFGIPAVAFLGTAAAVPLSLVGNSLFDTGMTISPTARSYRDGIGMAYGSTLKDVQMLQRAQEQGVFKLKCTGDEGYASDCTENLFDPDPVAMTFEELRTGLLTLKEKSRAPFWIINAAAPQSRSGLGWWAMGKEDVSNSDMFEMTAVSHGSGRYGYVSAPVSLHDMTVLDAVSASAAFFDANQLIYKKPLIRGPAGVGQHLAALDWGADISNYNVTDSRRALHRWLPIPFYWLDGGYARYLTEASRSKETQDRVRSSFIRLIDGGNGENLGVYSLFKRNVRNIVIADAAQDSGGRFGDLCSLASRLGNVPQGKGGYLYIPGLNRFDEHCTALKDHKQGYNIREWPFEFPALVGCIRKEKQQSAGASACERLSADDTRLIVIKPAINMSTVMARELKGYHLKTCGVPSDRTEPLTKDIPLLNCDAAQLILNSWSARRTLCQVFPQHSTVLMTANSSLTLFSAYRELARQYVNQAGRMISLLKNEDPAGIAMFSDIAKTQAGHSFQAVRESCKELLRTATR